MTSEPASRRTPGQPGVPERREITVRRAPRFVPFLVAGGLVGVLVAAIVALGGSGSAEYDRSTIFGFFAVLLAVPGVVLGGIVALILDRVSIRRMERAIVERDTEADGDAVVENGPGADPGARETNAPDAVVEPEEHTLRDPAPGGSPQPTTQPTTEPSEERPAPDNQGQ
jgi:hypothetical protein